MKDYSPAYDFVRAETGLTFPAARLESVARVFEESMAARRLHTASDLVHAMKADPSLRDLVVSQLTIGETYFFRDPGQLDMIRREIMPAVAASRPGQDTIRIWSAASASGEEPYSLAILLEQIGLSSRAEIIATDIARPRLASAQRGRYRQWSLRGVPQETVNRYFTRDGDAYELAPRIRERVSFRYLNLAEDTYPSLALGIYDMDLIVCRNVLIYFDETTICRVAQRLIDSLSPAGWLVIGASDPPISQLVDCDVITTASGLVYRRPGAGGAAALPSSLQRRDAYAESLRSDAVAYTFVPVTPDADPVQVVEPDVTAEPAVDVPAPAQEVDAQEGIAAVIARVRSMCNAGQTRAAATEAAHALDEHGDAAELHYLLAIALSHEDMTSDAIRAVRRALYLDRGFVIAHVLLGQLHIRAGDREAALRSFRNAAELLASEHADGTVVATDGERAGRIREAVAMQLRLLRAES